MIYNESLHRLTDVEIVKAFMHRQKFKLAGGANNFGLIIFRMPYVIEFKDALTENYLEVYFSDLDSSLYMEGSSALGCSVDLGLQSIATLRERDLTQDQTKEIFLSECDLKIRNLYSNIEAIEKLLPRIETQGGLLSIRDGRLDSRPDFINSVKPMWNGMKERYLRCIAVAESS